MFVNFLGTFTWVSLVLGLASVSAGLPNENSKRVNKRQEEGYMWWYWSVDTPTPGPASEKSADVYDVRSQDDNKWVSIDASDAGTFLENGPPYQVGYRLVGDPASSIIYHLSANYQESVTVSDVGDVGDIDGASISMNVYIDTSYPTTTAGSKTGIDPWSSTNLTTVVTSKSWSVQNVECNGSMNYTMTTVDANGTVEKYFGTDYISGNVPTALPANLTLTNGNDTERVDFYYTGFEPVSVAWGSAHRKCCRGLMPTFSDDSC